MASVPFKFSKVTVGDDFFDDIEPTYSVRLYGTTIGEVSKGEILVDPDDESLGWETHWAFVLTQVPYGKVLPEGVGKWGEGKSRPAAILSVLDRLEDAPWKVRMATAREARVSSRSEVTRSLDAEADAEALRWGTGG